MKQSFEIALLDTNAKDTGLNVGRIRIEDGKHYRCVRNKSAGARAIGDVGFFGTNDVDQKELYVLNQAAKGTLANMMAGVYISAPAADEYHWIQTMGTNPNIATLGHAASALGDAMIGVNDQDYITRSTGVGTAPLHRRHIIASVVYVTVAEALKSGWIHCT